MAAMLADVSDAPVCVTHERNLVLLPPEFTSHRLCLDLPSAPSGADATPAPVVAEITGMTPANLAYVIHTSGSTGKPKGCLNTHAGIRNRLLWMQDAYRLTGDDRVLHKTPVSFDPFVWEIFWPLIVGARVVVAKPEGHKDAAYLVRTIIEQDVTTMHFVPSMMRRFLAEPGVAGCTPLRQVFCSGEALPYDLRDHFLATLDAELYNLYGPPRRRSMSPTSTANAANPARWCRSGDRSPTPERTFWTPICNRCRWVCPASCSSAVSGSGAATSTGPT